MSSRISTTRRARISRRAALATVAVAAMGAGAFAAAGPAFADSGPVSGTVTVTGGTTVSLSSASFTLTAPTGATTTTASGITATVSSNDPNSYSLQEMLNAPGFVNGAVTGIFTITPRAGGVLASSPFTDTAHSVTVATKAGPSGPSGDAYALDWDFAVPANAVAGAYTGTIAVTALGN